MSKRELDKIKRRIYNEAVRDTVRELWLYDGIISDEETRKYLCTVIQKKLSYKEPPPSTIKFYDQ